MNREIADLCWPVSRLGEGIEALARRSGLDPATGDTPIVPAAVRDSQPAELGRWIAWAAESFGIEAEPIESPASEVDMLLRRAGPALLRLEAAEGPRFLLLLKSRRRDLQLLGPDLRSHRHAAESVRAALCAEREAPIAAEIEQLLEAAGVPQRRRRKARSALLLDRLGAQRIEAGWLLRLPPTAEFRRQVADARLPRRILLILAVFILVYGLEILGWSVIGKGALEGRLDPGWLIAWALLVLSLIPLESLGGWLEAMFALDAGRILKQRLLAGALRMDLESLRHQGAGQMLGRVIESQALESLALNGGLAVLVAIIELGFAGWILAVGAGGWFHLGLLFAWLGLLLALSWRYHRQLHNWTIARLDLTNELVERMVGHRTCLAQESAEHRVERQDHAVEGFLGQSAAMDGSLVPIVGLIPRGWLLLGLAGLIPPFVSGTGSPIGLAVGLGGILLANRALSGIAGGLSALARAAVAWTQIAPLFHAAQRGRSITPFLSTSQMSEADRGDQRPALIDATDLAFRYRPLGEPVLRGATVSIRRGDRVLLQGSSGGGKSTLSSLLVGLRSPESGLLLLNGLDRHTLGDGWHRLATAAPQFHENHVFTGTLAFNLLMGRRWPAEPQDLAEAEALCRDLGLGDLLDRMPAGLMQMVGETGWQLSHGERSRVFLARALLQGAQLTVLDESFAALDPETMEKCLSCAIKRARTLMVIAHP